MRSKERTASFARESIYARAVATHCKPSVSSPANLIFTATSSR